MPAWLTAKHLAFLAWTVFTAHYPALFIGGFLFFLAFTAATEHHQNPLSLRPALLVGFFLAGLVIHGGLQGWWIGPLLGRLSETPLLLGAMGLPAFNDNAAITRLILEKLLINPTEQLKSASDADTVAAYSDALTRLFGLGADETPDDTLTSAGSTRNTKKTSQ